MEKHYTVERNTQMLIYLMKKYDIKKVVASPGTTNLCLMGSIQNDSYFEIYSAADERSAAYMAVGLAEESGEIVALSCTGATASRNYVPALTEAFYRHIPVLAITAAQPMIRAGHLVPQFLDRSMQMEDLVKYSLQLQPVSTDEEEWGYGVKINEALMELTRNGGGPVHINLITMYSTDFSVKELPPVKRLYRHLLTDELPEIKARRVAIFVGAHSRWSKDLTEAVDAFCEHYNAVVFMDRSSNYNGKYGFLYNLVSDQQMYNSSVLNVELAIDIGNISGAYGRLNPAAVWRVHPDGVLRDRFRKLTREFAMEELDFFKAYVAKRLDMPENEYYQACCAENEILKEKAPDVPFSNVWTAQKLSSILPAHSVLHLGILNSLRSWNLVMLNKEIDCYANTGGFGIDGCVSTLIGASLANPQKIYFGVVGDLAFFYDMNSLGNRHVGNNVRLMVVNNGRGTEFRNYWHPAERFGDSADAYMAAAGHYGAKSPTLLKHYAKDLGFKYLSASNKEEFKASMDEFVSSVIGDKPILLEIFTDSKDESDALYRMRHIEKSAKLAAKQALRNTITDTVGEHGVHLLKKMLRKE
ncbi:thiamine pyrophosphate-binding protein [Selenomonas ruminantium]|uniref:thiamine pyrophosphate-binding protein n=1 Tax=Selenomonas ruminantium TaxID=971 RepID=UPI00041189CD|nr:thiamine pyrophosphate-binding protein [Selenomonas ruminantium]